MTKPVTGSRASKITRCVSGSICNWKLNAGALAGAADSAPDVGGVGDVGGVDPAGTDGAVTRVVTGTAGGWVICVSADIDTTIYLSRRWHYPKERQHLLELCKNRAPRVMGAPATAVFSRASQVLLAAAGRRCSVDAPQPIPKCDYL
jgi:hypothetical protein